MRILLVEDEPKLSSFIKKGLSEQGFAIDLAESGETAEALAQSNEYDLIILDVMLPNRNGFDTAKRLRSNGFVGSILMLTALSEVSSKVYGLESGADDYLCKPFAFEELSARIKALQRRQGTSNYKPELRVGDLTLDVMKRKASYKDRQIELSQKEFLLLEYLMKNEGRVLTRAQILEHVWNLDFDPASNVIDVYVNALRKKIGHSSDDKLIHTVVGAGYVLKEQRGRDADLTS